MIKQLSIIGVILILTSGCSKEDEHFDIKLLDSFASFSELQVKYDNIQIDSSSIFDESNMGYVLQLEIFNRSDDSLCLNVQNWSKYFLDVMKIQSKFPLEGNPNNWSLDILDNWGLENEACIESKKSKVFLTTIDVADLSNDSLIITFSSSTLQKGLDWKLPYLRSKK